MNRKTTIRDVARELGVSCATVSRVMNGAPGVSAEVREKVLAYAESVGYYPNSSIKNGTTGKLNVISLILGDIRNPFYADLVFQIQKYLNGNGYLLSVFNSEYNEDEEVQYIRLSEQFNFAGLILLTASTDKVRDALERVQTPVVLVNRILEGYQADSVLMDNFKAGYLAAMHLMDLGHQEIGFVRGHLNSSASTQRFQGYCQALQNFGIPIREECIFQGDLKMETGSQLARQYLQIERRPSAMILSNDATALGFLACCKENGVGVPGDLSIVSFDDIPYAALGNIQLTTVSQHVEEMSRHAAQLMLERLDNPGAEPRRIILDPDLIIRGTTARYQK